MRVGFFFFLLPEATQSTSCQGGGQVDQQQIDAEVKDMGSDYTIHSEVSFSATGRKEVGETEKDSSAHDCG